MPPPTTTELLLVRHGESESNQERRFGGHGAATLTALGERQAEATARALTERPVTAIYSSDLARAVATARPLALRTALEPTLTPLLRERSVGELTGLTFEEAAARFPETWAGLLRRELDFVPPGGESLSMCARRTGAFVDELLASQPEGRLVLVSHGVALDALLRHLLGVVEGPSVRCMFHSDNCAIHRLEQRGDGPLRIVKLNDTSHLAGLVTVEER